MVLVLKLMSPVFKGILVSKLSFGPFLTLSGVSFETRHKYILHNKSTNEAGLFENMSRVYF